MLIDDGYVCISEAVPVQTAEHWLEQASKCFAMHGRRVDREEGPAVALDEGGPYHYTVAASDDVRRWIPELVAWYESGAILGLLTRLCGREVVVSPYPNSAITLKQYDEVDSQGWHQDTNPLTVLLFLTAASAGQAIEIEGRDGAKIQLGHSAGDALVMFGRELKHRVLSPGPAAPRVAIPLNYYHPDDLWRPDEVDEVVYGVES